MVQRRRFLRACLLALTRCRPAACARFADAKCAVGEQTAMHLIIKAQASKPAEASGDTDKGGANSRCACVIS